MSQDSYSLETSSSTITPEKWFQIPLEIINFDCPNKNCNGIIRALGNYRVGDDGITKLRPARSLCTNNAKYIPADKKCNLSHMFSIYNTKCKTCPEEIKRVFLL